MTDRPLLLLDVDGPLNPFAARMPVLRGYTTHRLRPSVWLSRQIPGTRRHRRGLRVRLNSSHGEQLTGLPFDLAWASAWMHEANTMIAPEVGLPADLPVVEWPESFTADPDGLLWKTRPVLEWTAGRPFAWVDDMLTDRDVAHVAEHYCAPALLLRVHPKWGLREQDFTQLREWAESL
jgi:hypothetical protein